MIKSNDNMAKVLKQDGLKGHGDALALMPAPIDKLMDLLSFPMLSRISGGTWNVESMATGLNYLSELAQREDCFFQPWTAAARAKDPSKNDVHLISFRRSEKSKVAIVVPGGAYLSVASIVEGFPVAKRLNELGYSAFVLKYRCGKGAHAPNPIDDLAMAVKFLFAHAEQWDLDMEDYLIAGFSAGGHLAGCFGTETLGYTHYGLPKPGAMLLGYPVVTMDAENTHQQSRNNFLGSKTPSAMLVERWSVNKQITAAYPKSFVWQCDHDNTVPIENSRRLVEAMKENGVDVRYETFDSDAHGWGLGEATLAEGWLDRAIEYIEKGSK